MGVKRRVRHYFLGVVYLSLIVFIIFSGNKSYSISTTNTNGVKAVQSSQIVQKIERIKKVFSTNEIKLNGPNSKIEFKGTLTGYGPDCEGCGGRVGCYPNQDVRNGNIYYNDKSYGRIRILAADPSIPCGSIIKIDNYKFNKYDSLYGIVLDRGSAIIGLTMDLLYPSEKDTEVIGRNYNINFTIERWGW
ncbi:MAG: 3D domain-containing protein [Bacilli bacterium]|nr:3D domain-containing protein [Bacilli bacterium]